MSRVRPASFDHAARTYRGLRDLERNRVVVAAPPRERTRSYAGVCFSINHAGDRQRKLFDSLQTHEDATPGDICRAVWSIVADPAARSLLRLFFEVYGLALIDRKRFPAFFPGAIENWLGFLAKRYARAGISAGEARVRVTMVLAGFRGFLLDLCATDDDARVARAVALWIESLT